MNPVDRQLQIEDGIRATFEERGVAVYWPEHFVGEFGTREEVLAALAGFVKAGKLEAIAQVRSPGNHICWQGSPEAFAHLEPFTCSECGETIDEPRGHAVAFFRITPRWRQIIIDAKKKTQVAWAY